ncbi:Rho-binding antiterminator [Shewanella pealeana]|uniref:Transcriptional antiterminator, Rof n=1 Tax=Shewanella pealeana (strain ATCC 700345 / ANG-SQ1) TaxID=398579 RepID=A8H694_SHEPA|nr:Rho-binding antiterminator [Shewanella pealeana]ABV88081.1 transcriptional antiterminator, Rof [Shewanella pealeana ATCC 700345]
MLSCSQHDYIELVCIFNYPIKLTMKNGDSISGKALDTCRNTQKQHCIKLVCKQQNCIKGSHSQSSPETQLSDEAEHRLIVLDDIASMQVCVDNPHLDRIELG